MTLSQERQERKTAFPRRTLTGLLEESYEKIGNELGNFIPFKGEKSEGVRRLFKDWIKNSSSGSRVEDFLKSVEEWKGADNQHLSENLLVVITFLFERLIPELLDSQMGGKQYSGKILPRKIGRKKDFWNRLNSAYQDLQIQSLLRLVKKQSDTSPQRFLNEFFEDCELLLEDRISSDPVSFPGFRFAIEDALKKSSTPCGLITGTGKFKGEKGTYLSGFAISNSGFQAGAFDMASAEKFCALLVKCAKKRIPVICFISSGGMQTKEGAGALFSMAAVNDRADPIYR